MDNKEFATALIHTKLNRPPLPPDLVPRPRLTDLNVPLPPFILISAPAGYGKSTLMKCLLDVWELPFAWLSLDEHDADLGDFLRYILAAIHTIFPDALPEIQALLMSAPLPPLPAITKNLINELNQLEQPYVLVLDDYHAIDTQDIHDLLSELLIHPPRNLHLMMGTRMDPPLPLVTLRARGQMLEIRTQDLRFNHEESLLLFQKMIGETVDQDAIGEINAKAEGWVTGLRLAALAMRHRIGRGLLEGEFSLQNQYISEYLVSEILAKQPTALSDCMLKISILERFCADLCAAVCFPKSEHIDVIPAPQDLNGSQFIDWLRNSNLFVIPLDAQQEWFRYHHLFQNFLQKELTDKYSSGQIAALHAAAGAWYAQNGWIEEGLYHLLAANETKKAIQLVAHHRNNMLNTTQWPRLERWLNLFPAEAVESSEELWMLRTWLVYHNGRFAEIPAMLKHLVDILESSRDQPKDNYLIGEISTLRSLVAYFRGAAEEAVRQAQVALDQLPSDLWIVRILARTYLGGSYLLCGEETHAYHAFYDGFEEEQVQNKHFKATLLMAACNFHWITADLENMAQAAKQCIALCQETGQQEILDYGRYQLGRARYHQDKLAQAEQLFAGVVARPYLNYGISYTNSACGLALTYQAQGKEVEAVQVSNDAVAYSLETGNTSQLPLILALQAELGLMQGHFSKANQWAEQLDPVPPLTPMPWFLAPHLTLVKVWLAQNTPGSLEKASELLNQLRNYLASIHNTRFLIETLALQALLDQVNGDQLSAQADLEKALRLAQPGGFIRLFVDLGPAMADLISQLQEGKDLSQFVNLIRSTLPGTHQAIYPDDPDKFLESLTNRELEILALLAERKTNKEIALLLGITSGTVRQHSHNLYQKLEVSNRREAVIKAQVYGLLSH
ncbi:MAG: hypothetical protein JSV42_18790 [Chloroflexota bacterium]|nr:MAG: hypothetical protein JSV42_18790 [Chloroflexota bacterium]